MQAGCSWFSYDPKIAKGMRITLFFIALICSTAARAQAVTQGEEWSPVETVWRNPTEFQSAPEVVVVGGTPTITLFKRRWTADSLIVGDALLVTRRLGGTWTPPVRLGTRSPLDLPSTTSDGVSLFAVWPEGTRPLTVERLVSVSEPPAGGPTAETIVERDLAGPRPHLWPSFQRAVTLGDQPAVVFQQSTDAGNVVAFTRRRPDGTWTAPYDIAEGLYADLLHTPDGMLVVPYLALRSRTGEQSIAVSLSRDGGATWSDHRVASRPSSETLAFPRALRDAMGRLHVVWGQSTAGTQDFDLFGYSYSDDEGQTWTSPEEIRPSRPWVHLGLQLLGDHQGNLHVFAFQLPDPFGAVGEIVHTARQRDGRWTPQQTLFDAHRVWWAPRVPSLAVADGRIHAVWSAQENGQLRTQYASAPVSWLAAQVQMDSSGAERRARAFPNPATDSVTFLFAPFAAGPITFRLSTADGRVITETRLGERPAGAQRYTVSTAALASGTYVFTFITVTDRLAGTVSVIH